MDHPVSFLMCTGASFTTNASQRKTMASYGALLTKIMTQKDCGETVVVSSLS